jgi:hypothetical protein
MSKKSDESLSEKVLLGAVSALSGIGTLEAVLGLATGEKPTASKVISAAGIVDLDGVDVDSGAKSK